MISNTSWRRFVFTTKQFNNSLEVAHDTYLVYIGMSKQFVKIENYQEGCSNFTHLLLEARQSYRKQLECEIKPVTIEDGFGYSEVFDFSDNPLTAGISISCGAMPRKNQKRIDQAQADLIGMGKQIADLWNKRDFDGIKALFS